MDYRLAPECPYPAAVNDTYSAVKGVWQTLIRRQLNFQRRLSIAGDSAGGALCATVAHSAQFDNSSSLKKSNNMKLISNACSGPALSYFRYTKVFKFFAYANRITYQRKTL